MTNKTSASKKSKGADKDKDKRKSAEKKDAKGGKDAIKAPAKKKKLEFFSNKMQRTPNCDACFLF